MALAALAGDKTLAELAQKFQVHPTQITDWKRQQEGQPASVFDKGGKAEPEVDLKTLHAKIGQLTLENDFLEGVKVSVATTLREGLGVTMRSLPGNLPSS